MNTKLIIPFLILALLAGGVMLGCNDDNSPTAALPDYRPPSVEWIAPSPDADLSGETTLLIAASDDDEVANVAVYLNGQAPDDWRVAGHADTLYSFTWDTRDFPDSFYNLEARAWDASGNLGTSPALLVRVANDTTSQPEEDNTAPDVWWTAPDPGNVSGEVELSFRVLDDNTLQRVRIYQNGVMPEGGDIAVNDEGVYSLNWNTLADSDGVYSWEARAWDASGNLGTSPALLVRVSNDTTSQPEEDNTAPDVWWTAPDPGNVRGEVELSFRVLDDNPLQRVRIYQNGVMPEGGDIAVNDEGVYSLNWNTLADSDGVYSWEARAWDASGNLGISPALLVRVSNDTTAQPDEDRTPPVIAWMSPEPGDTLQSVVNLRFQIIDESPIDTAIVMMNGQQFQTRTNLGAFYNGDEIWDTSESDDGIYLIQIKAMDSARNVAYSEVIRFTVWNSRPRVIWVPDNFETIQGAINFSSDFDTIRVRPGTYRESIRLMGKDIWLESEEGPERTVIDGTEYGTTIFSWDGECAVIRGITVLSDWHAINIVHPSQTIVLNCILKDNPKYGIWLDDSNGCIYNSIIEGCGFNGIDTEGGVGVAYSTGIVKNCIFIGNRFGIVNFRLWNTTLEYGWNLFWNNQESDYLGLDPKMTDIFENPLFQINSYRLQNFSPAIDAGDPTISDRNGTQSDIGLYGGPYSY